MSPSWGRRGIASLDVLLVLAGLAIVAALVYPSVHRRAHARRVSRTISDIEALRDAATRYRAQEGHWPANAGPGHVPDDLARLVPAGVELRTRDHVLGWSRWDVVETPVQPEAPAFDPSMQPPPTPPPVLPGGAPADSVTVPPPLVRPSADTLGTRPSFIGELGGITVQSTDDGLLGTLLERYGTATSFVRSSTWTLVLGGNRTR